MIEPGTHAPGFSLPDHDGNPVTLGSFAGRRLVLAFYPLDFSVVCTDQLSIYQEVLGEIESRDATLVGISVDSSACHAAFREKLGLTFPLLAVTTVFTLRGLDCSPTSIRRATSARRTAPTWRTGGIRTARWSSSTVTARLPGRSPPRARSRSPAPT